MRPATPDEVCTALELAADTFEGSKLRRGTPAGAGWTGEGSHCLVGLWEGEPVSALFAVELAVYWPRGGLRDAVATQAAPPRTVFLGVRPLVGVVSVVTRPPFRGRGLARALLDHLQQLAAERGAVGCALFSEIGPEFYRQSGYVSVPLAFLRGPLPAPPARTHEDAPGRRFVPADLPGVARAYEMTASAWPLAVARDEAYWRRHLSLLAYREDLISAGDRGRDFVVIGSPVRAYLRSRSDGDIFTVLELAWTPGAEEEARELLRSELGHAAAMGCVRCVLHLPPGCPPPAETTWKRATLTDFMVRPVAGALDELDGYHPYVFRPDHY